MSVVRGAIFDVDGTLLDSMEIWQDLGQRYLAGRGIEAKPGLQEMLNTMSTKQGTEYICEKYNLSEAAEQVLEEIKKMIERFYKEEVVLKKGARKWLELLEEKGIPMIVATSGEKELVEAAFKRLGVEQYFHGILTCSKYNTDKTKPDIYLEAAKQIHTSPQQTLVFEDVLHALETAKKAGFRTVAVYDRYSEDQQEEMNRLADYYIGGEESYENSIDNCRK